MDFVQKYACEHQFGLSIREKGRQQMNALIFNYIAANQLSSSAQSGMPMKDVHAGTWNVRVGMSRRLAVEVSGPCLQKNEISVLRGDEHWMAEAYLLVRFGRTM